MFKKSLEEKFKAIFKPKKLTYNRPGESMEQQVLFIEIESSYPKIQDGREKAWVTGKAYMLSGNEQLPFGYFAKAIKQADSSLTKDLFFYDFEENTQRFLDIIQMGFSFQYFFDSQYDPRVGSITSIDINIEEQT